MTANLPFSRRGWSPDRLPSLIGKTAVITGANSGIGFEAAAVMAERGVQQIWLCRNIAKADAARQQVLTKTPGADIEVVQMDLADLDSVRAAAAAVRERVDGIDALINNAGIMMLPKRERTAQGMEMQLGVNHMAHFALNALLCDRVEARAGRFVGISSIAHKSGRIHQDNLQFETGYGAITAYGQSKLANLMYVLELDRRLKKAGCTSVAIACHPGYSATNLQTTGPGSVMGALMSMGNKIMAQKAENGAYPTLLAAFEPQAVRATYYGPTSFGDVRGPVGVSCVSKRAGDEGVAGWLWQRSAELTDTSFEAIGL